VTKIESLPRDHWLYCMLVGMGTQKMQSTAAARMKQHLVYLISAATQLWFKPAKRLVCHSGHPNTNSEEPTIPNLPGRRPRMQKHSWCRTPMRATKLGS